MSIRCYFQPKDSLPDARGELASSVPSQANANANREVLSMNESMQSSKKRGAYRRLASMTKLISLEDYVLHMQVQA